MEEKILSEKKAQIIYFSHGGGPLPFLATSATRPWWPSCACLPERLRKPDAILVISAHWEEDAPHCWVLKLRTLFYDYYGFPEQPTTLPIRRPEVLRWRSGLSAYLKRNRISADVDAKRGFDHGLFIPLKLMYPEADIPALQLSLLRGSESGKRILLSATHCAN